ncbi:MAG: hypothetical protein QNI89_02445 [Desulfobacterales bacterium]|nr:hypothetical protein [Desulfobacterales bacterium]MDJ0886127.1 hypothetical protein [Desulfobacterales bacterium]MDJ0989069.1 hypothetical protein [Desulfobacterales bacterium]
MRSHAPPAALILCAALVIMIAPAAVAAEREPGLTTLAAPPEGWRPTSAPVTAAGAALFNVINGGAEMYLQAGFRQAVFSAFQNPDGLDVNLEIYEMRGPEAARAVFLQKAGNSGRAAAYGQEARLDSYYLNFWRGPHQVTISGYASTTETVAAIRELAATVDKRLRGD